MSITRIHPAGVKPRPSSTATPSTSPARSVGSGRRRHQQTRDILAKIDGQLAEAGSDKSKMVMATCGSGTSPRSTR